MTKLNDCGVDLLSLDIADAPEFVPFQVTPKGMWIVQPTDLTVEKDIVDKEDHPYHGKEYFKYAFTLTIKKQVDSVTYEKPNDTGKPITNAKTRKQLIVTSEEAKEFIGSTIRVFANTQSAGLVYDKKEKEWRIPKEDEVVKDPQDLGRLVSIIKHCVTPEQLAQVTANKGGISGLMEVAKYNGVAMEIKHRASTNKNDGTTMFFPEPDLTKEWKVKVLEVAPSESEMSAPPE